MTKRLAVTIAGAVSLGSYEAGVLFELLAAIESHNAEAERRANGSLDRIEIDVLTGASAGAMTAAIVAQKLLLDPQALRDPAGNALYSAWVKEARITSFLETRSGEDPLQSFLSSLAIDEIADRHLTPPAPAGATQPHPAAAEKVRLGLTLSNLSGVEFQLDLRPFGNFEYVRHADVFDVGLSALDAPGRVDWKRVKSAAIASGAFPLAFRVRQLVRQRSEYVQENLLWIGQDREMVYTDGGVFQNEPLGLAKHFVDDIDDHRNVESRFYIFVSPGGRGASQRADFVAGNATLLRTASRLAYSIIDQAQFQDWITAEGVNERIVSLDKVALQLQGTLVRQELGPDAIAPLVNALLTLIFPAQGGKPNPDLLDGRSRLSNQYVGEYAELRARVGQEAADVWIDAVLVFEYAADLGRRDEMQIYAVTASPNELAGTGLHSFQGFFDESYRQHDYDVGRNKARKVIRAINDRKDRLGPIHYPAADQEVPVAESLSGLSMGQVDPELRKKLFDQMRRRINDMLKAAGVNVFERLASNNFVVPKILKKILEL